MRPDLSIRRPVAILAMLAVLTIAGGAGWLAGRISRQPRPPAPPGEPVAFAALAHLDQDDLVAFFRAFRTSCGHRDARAPAALIKICADAEKIGNDRPSIEQFLRAHFVPRRLPAAFFTGYYEPVVDASLVATARFKTPLLALPSGVVSVRPGTTPGLDPVLTAAWRQADGSLAALPDRAGVETGALGAAAHPIAFVDSPLDAFFIQIQGSARLKLPDGGFRRLVYAGRNGYPYTAIGKILVARYGLPAAQMGMSQVKNWIRNHGQGEGDEGTRLMRENRSYIFFRFDDTSPPTAGPTGAEGVNLTALRSLAIDHAIWPYGLPFYVDTTSADGKALQVLSVAQDTGAAIKGAARADIFFGSGDGAAAAAGAQRSGGTLYALWPREGDAP